MEMFAKMSTYQFEYFRVHPRARNQGLSRRKKKEKTCMNFISDKMIMIIVTLFLIRTRVVAVFLQVPLWPVEEDDVVRHHLHPVHHGPLQPHCQLVRHVRHGCPQASLLPQCQHVRRHCRQVRPQLHVHAHCWQAIQAPGYFALECNRAPGLLALEKCSLSSSSPTFPDSPPNTTSGMSAESTFSSLMMFCGVDAATGTKDKLLSFESICSWRPFMSSIRVFNDFMMRMSMLFHMCMPREREADSSLSIMHSNDKMKDIMLDSVIWSWYEAGNIVDWLMASQLLNHLCLIDDHIDELSPPTQSHTCPQKRRTLVLFNCPMINFPDDMATIFIYFYSYVPTPTSHSLTPISHHITHHSPLPL